ncbi:MAG: type I-D CRISPR-associated protein Cas5/Csc1 [Ruminiclostridium sp.]|nr:type I-D CRISPR-associated protein Cas5/Csc1 [Ruminiclostridium sp.]
MSQIVQISLSSIRPPIVNIKVRAFKGIIELMSELFFASLEPGDNFTTEPILLNTALFYALGYAKGNNINFPVKKGRAKQNPTYIEDTSDMVERIYVTPAKPINKYELTTEIYNSRSDDYVQSNKLAQADENANTPTGRYGARKQIQPGARFLFYVLTFDGSEPDMPPYIRLGKKRCKARVEWEEVSTATSDGLYHTTHPVLIDDLDSIPLGDITFKRMQPFDIIQNARFSGTYLKIDNKDVLPLNVRFLRRIRN